MDVEQTRTFVARSWEETILPTLKKYIEVPSESPAFDPSWQEHGHMDRAVELVVDWIRAQEVPGLKHEVVRLPGRTPVLFVEVAGEVDATVMLYGHLDKQPPMTGWSDGLGPWTPVVRDGKLYGRGGADDGYAAFAAVSAVKALRLQGIPHARCVIVIECCEESGSYDLPHYIDHLSERIGTPNLIVCLDSGCGDYERLWMTTSLRGMVLGTLTVSVLDEGVHSGDGSGVAPSSFRVLRQLISRLEDEETGRILPAELQVEVPADRLQQAGAAAKVLGSAVYEKYPWAGNTRPVSSEPRELLLNKTWRPQLEITGASGLPAPDTAGNVLRPTTAAKLSLRLPPTADPDAAGAFLKVLFESDPPYGATVTFELLQAASGWNAPPLQSWLEAAVATASEGFFHKTPGYMGEGGSIPFMAMLGDRFPRAQFMITGVLGPQSNAHGPNEFLEIGTAERLTGCVAHVLEAHGTQAGR